MWSISKQIEVSCAHRLEGHFKCSRLHGHNYIIEATVFGETLDNGMLVDFGDLKACLTQIHDMIDHKYIVSRDNISFGCPFVEVAKNDEMIRLPIVESTAENIAKWVADELAEVLPEWIQRIVITVWETSTSHATYERDR